MTKITKATLSRREFLIGGGLIGAAALIQACQGQGTPTPIANISTSIPTQTATGAPTSSPTATPGPGTATATAPLDPTATFTATTTPLPITETPTSQVVTGLGSTSPIVPTETATAIPTPTPTPTPYPPGPPSKLGLFLTRFDAQALQIIENGQPPLVKTLELDPNFAQGIKDLSPNTILIGRLVLEDQLNLDADPIPLARQFVEQLLPIANEPTRFAAFDAWEAYNEPLADNPEKMKRLADFEAERTRLLGEQGIRSVIGNFATGHPGLELWPEFAPALAAVQQYDGYLGLHEYSAPIMQFGFGALQPEGGADQGDEGWLTIRYRKVYRQQLQPMGFGNVPLLITECGVDGLVGNRPGPADADGWQDFVETWLQNGLRNDPPGVYMDQLIWYDSELRKDDYVLGATIFVAGASPGWESYDISGRTGELLQQYLEVHPQFR